MAVGERECSQLFCMFLWKVLLYYFPFSWRSVAREPNTSSFVKGKMFWVGYYKCICYRAASLCHFHGLGTGFFFILRSDLVDTCWATTKPWAGKSSASWNFVCFLSCASASGTTLVALFNAVTIFCSVFAERATLKCMEWRVFCGN